MQRREGGAFRLFQQYGNVDALRAVLTAFAAAHALGREARLPAEADDLHIFLPACETAFGVQLIIAAENAGNVHAPGTGQTVAAGAAEIALQIFAIGFNRFPERLVQYRRRPAETEKFIKDETARYAAVIKARNIKAG